MDVKQKIKSLVRSAIFKALAPDGSHQIGDFTFLGVEQRGVIYSPYGLYSKPESNSFAVLLQSGAKEDSIIALVWNPKDKPNLENGDVALHTPKGNMSLILHKNGKLEINGASDDMVNLIGKLGDYTQDIITKLSTTTVATALGASPLSTQADWILMLTNPSDNIIDLVAKIKAFEVT